MCKLCVAQVRSKLNKDGSEAADKFAKILAKYAEKAYLPQDSSAGRRSNIISNTLTVREMQAIFLLTAANTLYFSHTQSLQVDVQGGKRVLEDALLDERRSRESSAAEEASAELVKLVTHAENRGLSIADSFSHFDEKKNGFVDVELLISGLAKLGIGLTYPVAEALMQIIGGVGSFFVSYSDFELYIRRNSAGENRNSDAALKASASAKKAGAESAASDDLERKIGSQLRLPHQRRGAAKAALNSRNVMKATTESVDLSGFDDLPMVESAYTSVPSVSRSTELPPWASARQRDALREIKRAQKKRRGGGAELDSCGGANAEKAEGRKKSRLSSNVSAVAVPDAVGARQSNSASSLRDGSIKNSPSKAASLNLQGITADASSLVAEKLQTERDEVLHIDSGVVMTFRVVIGKGRDDANRMQEKVDSLRYRSKLEENEKVLQAADGGGAEEEGDESRSGSTPQLSESRSAADTNPYSVSRPKSESEEKDRWLAFTLILVPDVFMTLETLHKSFEPIVVKYPLARLVIVGPPGSPYTHWPRGWILNADMQSRSILSLLLHLKERGRVGERSDPVFMMGFGTGAHTLSRFVSLFLPALDWMQRRLKSVVLVNGFIHISKGFKRVCKDLRSSLLLAKPIEVAELVSSLHFSDDFLRSNNRQNCQKLFWATRRGLCSINQNDIAQIHLQDGKQYAGVLEQLRGLLIGPDVLNPADSFLMSTKIPLFVIQGTDDVFVNPTEISMAYSKKSLDSANRVLVTGVLEGLVPGSIHLSWLKCGHEILVERPAYLLALISNFIQEIRVIPDDSDDSNLNYGYQDDIDPVELAKMRREAAAREQQRLARERQEKLEAEEAEAHRQRLEQEELHRQQVLFDLELERDREAAELAGEKERRLLEEEQEARAEQLKEKEEAARKAAKREREKSSRLEAMAERKRRDVKEARKAELQELYETQRLFNERKAEAYEISRMVLEDERSSDLRVYDAECEAAELAAQLAREKIQDLFNGRREDAMKKIEEQLAFQRAERLEKRRREAEESMQKIEQEEAVFMDVSKYKLLHIPGEVSIDIEVNDEQEDAAREARDRALESIDLSREAIAECIANTHNIYKDYMSCRQKLIEAMKRQRLVEDKTMLFRTQRDDLEADIRKLQRALRLFVKGTLAAELGATAFELEELKSTLADKESTLTEFTAIGRDKENHLASTNRSVQLLKVAVAKLEDVLSKQLSSIQIVEKQLSARARKLKFQKENELITRDKHISSKSLVILRLDIVKAEYIRVKAHKEEFVDSDVLFDGVLQRCVTKTLRKHLKLERSKWEGRVQAIENEIASAQDKIDTVNEKQIICKLDLDKLSLAIKNFFRGYNRARKQSVVDDVSEALALQERASSIQARRDSENDNMSHAEMVEFLAGKPATGLASRTRKKPLDLRTKEDRKFIAIDLILHPEEYLEINVTEAEEMQFDPDYQCELKKSDLERIEKLPELIALAMPFLHSKSEVSVHRLMNIYYRDKDDAYYEKKDFLSYGIIENEKMSSILSVSSTEEKMSLTSANISPTDMSNAEIIHEILIKESRRDRVRTMVCC